MPTWPSGTKAGTTNVDNPNDLVANARADIKQNIDNVNDIIDTFNISSPSDGDLLQYSSSSGQWEQVTSSSVGSAADFALIQTTSDDDDNELISGSDYRRGLSTEFDPNSLVTLNDSAGMSNQFSLGAGDYIVEVNEPLTTSEAQASIYNETDATSIGIIAAPNLVDPSQGTYQGIKGFTLSSTKNLSIRVTSGSAGSRSKPFTIKFTKF